MRVIVTGGAGFIGSALVRRLVAIGAEVLNLDKLTYAGDLGTLAAVEGQPNYRFLRADVTDAAAINAAFAEFRPDAVVHLAAESHVDRSIDGPAAFLSTNIFGTYVILEAALAEQRRSGRDGFRLLLVSTDEVYGSLGPTGKFSETTAYAPNSPYSASKAAADHLGRAWFKTYGLKVINTNCSNNYGPFQNGEKLIPTVIRNALAGAPIPVYGTGENVRDWIHVEDHIAGLLAALAAGTPGEKYNLGGAAERANIELVRAICAHLDQRQPLPSGASYADQIRFATDRPGHDFRYAVDAGKAELELGWRRVETFETGLAKTIDWYLEHPDWLGASATAGRLGLARVE